ncbi:PrgI family mobile element protein [Desulfocucumis palustris]|nr:PrgI family protein [Desulfocucumis palustris]
MNDSMDSNMKSYLIPQNVETKFQFFPGFGWFEVGAVAAAFLLGALLVYVLGWFTNSPGKYILLLLPPAAAFFLFKPTPDGSSLYQLLKNYRDWLRSRKRYLYEYRED